MSAPSVRPRSPGEALADATWIEPIPDARIVTTADDPADVAETRDSVHLAFVAALQYLPPMQRAVLLLRDVMGLSAIESAQLLGKSVASVNSSLQRARATLADQRARSDDSPEPLNDAQRALLTQYVDAFSRYDMDTLAMLMHIDAIMSMPPHTMWMKGLAEIQAWLLGPGVECRGSRLVPTFANAMPAFGQYRPSKLSDGYEPWALHVIEISAGRITALNVFRDTERFFPLFGLPDHLAA
jgi:RNA polymerase sigma-70 factor (ECF subfamily)